MKQVVKGNINIKAGLLMRKFRVDRGWEQYEMARKLGMTPSAYSKIEAGLTDVNYSRLEQIARVLKVRIIDLLAHDPEGQSWSSMYVDELRRQLEKRRRNDQELHDQLSALLELAEGHLKRLPSP